MTTRSMKGLEGKLYEEWLRSLEVPSAWRTLTLLRSSMSLLGREEADTDLFALVTNDRTQGNSLKMSQ